MSIVNQMLKDLDARCGPTSGNQLAALQSLGLIAANRSHAPNLRTFLTWGCASLFAVLAAYQAVAWWRSDHQLVDSHLIPLTLEAAAPTSTTRTAYVRPVEPQTSEATRMHPQPGDKLQDEADIGGPEPVPTAPHPIAATAPVAEPSPAEPIKKLSAQQKADRFFADAQVALDEQDYGTGEILLRQALFAFPHHHVARTQLAALLTARQNTDAAERLLSQGLQLNEQEAMLARPYAQLLVARGELEPALSALNTAIAGDRTDAETYALRAAILHRIGRHAAAAADYRLALAEQNLNAVWWVGLAIAEEHEQLFQPALTAYRKAARLPMEDALRNYVNQRIKLMQVTDGQ